MKQEISLINQFDSCVKNALNKELKYRLRTMKNQNKYCISIGELSFSEQAKLISNDSYPSEQFKEKLTTRLFETVIEDELLYEALQEIKPTPRELLVLKYWGDLTDCQVGQVMNLSRDSVTKMKNRALKNLKHIIEEMRKHER